MKTKKVIALIMSIVMTMSVLPIFASAASKTPDYPVIYLRGAGMDLYDSDGNKVWKPEIDTSKIPKRVANVVFPHLINAIATGNWEPWYDAFEKEFADIFGKLKCDDNGDTVNGVGIAKHAIDVMNNTFSQKNPNPRGEGIYPSVLNARCFYYDFRTDPYVEADKLQERVKQLEKTLGVKKINLWASCAGGTVVMAYLDKYGTDDVNAVMFDSAVVRGSFQVSAFFKGDIKLDGNSISRYIVENPDKDEPISELLNTLLPILKELVFLLNTSGGFDMVDSLFQMFYSKINTELVPRLLLTFIGTWGHYWDSVLPEDYEACKNYVFHTDELKQQYAGLIEKVDYYQSHVASKVPELLAEYRDEGVKLGFVSKYGFQCAPFTGNADMLNDDTVCVTDSSIGTTIAKNVNSVLPKDYIDSQREKGLGRYISPDSQIDASTCMFADSTWYVKGMRHNDINAYDEVKRQFFLRNGNLTVNDLPNFPQFLMKDTRDKRLVPMTSENYMYANEYVSGKEEDKTPLTVLQRFSSFMSKLLKLLMGLFDKIFYDKVNNALKK